MRVRCVANQGDALPQAYWERGGYTPRTKFQLTVGKEYRVYALEELPAMNVKRYFVCDDRFMGYPIGAPQPLFEVIDATPSRHWSTLRDTNGYVLHAFKEWANERFFYDHLSDLQAREVAIFAKYKELLDQE